jgi:biotin transporter BioY
MTNTQVSYFIYIIGYILSFILCKILRDKSKSNNWDDIVSSVFLSILSWFFIILVGIVYLLDYLMIKKPKPPKWL